MASLLLDTHILLWLVIFGICAIPGAALGFISWWWVIGPGAILGTVLAGDFIAGWRRGPLYPPRV